jgi:hypothetical protein
MAWNPDDPNDIALIILDLELMHKWKKAVLESEIDPRYAEQLADVIDFFYEFHAEGRKSTFVEFVGKVPPEEAHIKGPSSKPRLS